MRVIFLSTDYPTSSSHSGSGVGTFVYKMAHALVERGISVGVVTWTPAPSTSDWVDDGVFVYYTKPVGNFHYYLARLHFPRALIFFVKIFEMEIVAIKRLSELCSKSEDKVIVELPNGNISTMWWLNRNLKKIPYVVMVHGSLYLHMRGLGQRMNALVNFMEWLAVRFMLDAQAVVAPSQFVADYYQGVLKKHVHCIYPIVSMPNLDNKSVHENTNATTVLSVSALSWDKGMDVLIKSIPYVLSKLQRVTFVIIGAEGGVSVKDLHKQLQDKGVDDKVKFLGYVPWSNIFTHYAMCDIFVTASRSETFGQTVAEAMLLGKPVVATRAGAIPELVENRVTGLLVQPNDAIALAGAIIELIEDKALAKKLGDAGLEKVRREFGAENIVSQRIELYEKVLRNEPL